MKPGQRGSILILVLFALMTLSLLAFSVGYTVRQKLHTALRFETRAQLRLAADAAADQTAVFISENLSNQTGHHARNQRWSHDEGLWKKAVVGKVTYFVVADGAAGQEDALYGLKDEDRKINLNQAKPEVLQGLFQHAGRIDREEARRIAAAIRDWRDEDTDLSDGGAESKDYMRKTPPYQAKNALFDTLEELHWVQGVTPELYDKVAPYLTVYGGKVNLNTAPPVVLLAMGIDDRTTGKIVAFRDGKDGRPGTLDDGAFNSLSEASQELTREQFLSEEEIQNLDTALTQGFSVSSAFFTMSFLGKLEHQKQVLNAEVVFNNQGKVLRWSEKFS